MASSNDRDRLAGAKLLLSELYEPAVEREREREAETAGARERLTVVLEETSRRAVLRRLVECGLIRPGGGSAFTGVEKFSLRELAEWAGAWTPAPVAITEVACGGCGRTGVRLVKEGEIVDGKTVYCETCESQ